MASKSTLVIMREFFGMTTAEFSGAWRKFTDKDKSDLRAGFENGTLTY